MSRMIPWLTAFTLFTVSSASAATLYTVTDLGAVGGFQYGDGAYALNNSGQVVGFAHTSDGVFANAFLYSNGIMQGTGTLSAYPYSFAEGINNSGQIAGLAQNSSYATQAFLSSGGTMLDLGTLGGAQSWAWGINDSGQVVGWADNGGGQ